MIHISVSYNAVNIVIVYAMNVEVEVVFPVSKFPVHLHLINMTRHRDLSTLHHFCIHVHVYLFVRVHVCLSIGLTVMHI